MPLDNALLSMPGKCFCRSIRPTAISSDLPKRLDALYWIAQESSRMLHSHPVPLRRSLLRARMKELGFITGRSINWDSVANALKLRYGSKTLEGLGYHHGRSVGVGLQVFPAGLPTT
jgi:hypothetical protein